MHSSFLDIFQTSRAISAFCWTLVHSLWIGLFLALAAGLVMVLTSKSAPRLRYALLTGLFLLFLIAMAFTFSRQWQHFQPVSPEVIISPSGAAGQVGHLETNFQAEEEAESPQGYIDRIVNYVNGHGTLVVTIWFIIFSARLVRILSNIVYIERVRYRHTRSLNGTFWYDRTRELANILGVRFRVEILESELIRIPLTAGYLKPVILFPVSMLSQLPPDEVEAVLLHELAHIKRKDYLVNLLQSFAVTIFLCIPGLLWVSSLIRDERENCCDEMAIAVTNNRNTFVRALVSFQEHSMSPGGALAFGGRKNHLLNRVRRIVTNSNSTLDNMEKVLLATGLVVFGLVTLAFSQASQSTGPLKKHFRMSHSEYRITTDTVPVVKPDDSLAPIKEDLGKIIPDKEAMMGGVQVSDTVPSYEISSGSDQTLIQGDWEGKKYRIVESYDNAFSKKPGSPEKPAYKVTALYIDGKKVPDDKIPSYMPVIDKIRARMIMKMDQQTAMLKFQQLQLEKAKLQLSKDTLRFNIDTARFREQQAALMAQLAMLQKDMEQKSDGSRELEEAQKEILKNQALLQAQADLFARQKMLDLELEKKGDQGLKNDELQMEKLRIQLLKEAEALKFKELKMSQMKIDQDLVSPPKQDPYLVLPDMPAGPPPPPSAKGRSVASIIWDLKKDRIISDESKLSFTLNNRVLIVNGKQQPQEVFSRFRSKYIKNPKDHFICTLSKNSTSTDVYIQ